MRAKGGNDMKAITLWQPWATAVARGSKRMETRSWRTSYKGPLAIHAAKRCDKDELVFYRSHWNWCGALGLAMAVAKPLWEELPFGAIVAVATLKFCIQTDRLTLGDLDQKRQVRDGYEWCERQLGDYTLGRWAWVLEDVTQIEPIPWKGRQGLFEIPDEVLEVRS